VLTLPVQEPGGVEKVAGELESSWVVCGVEAAGGDVA
jgi:hypothetical protein